MNQQGQFKWPIQQPASSQQPASQAQWQQQPIPQQYPQPQQVLSNPSRISPVPSPQTPPLWPQGYFPMQQAQAQPQGDSISSLHYPLPLPKTRGGTVFKVTLYFTGIFLAEVGIFGIAWYASNQNNQAGGIGLLLGVCVAIGSAILFFRKKYQIGYLPWMKYLWWVLGTTLGEIIALGFVFGFLPNSATSQLRATIASCTLILYGIVLAWIAHMKPLLHLQEPKHAVTVPSVLPHPSQSINSMQIPITPPMQHIAKEAITPPPVVTPASPTSLGVKKAFADLEAQREAANSPPKQVPASPHVQNSAVPAKGQKQQVASQQMQRTVNKAPVQSPVQIASPIPSRPKGRVSSAQPKNSIAAKPRPSVMKPSFFVKEKRHRVKIFICYAHEDEPLLKRLKTHLKPLQRQGIIDMWHDRDISAGTEWKKEISDQLNAAQIILLLVSPDFMASDYCYGIEMKQAMQRHERGEILVIPIILRPTAWQMTPFNKLQALPKEAKPVSIWANKDQALLNIVEGIRNAVEELTKKLAANPSIVQRQASKQVKPNNGQYNPGQKVQHDKYGEGTILKSELVNRIIEVQFQSRHGIKRISTEYTGLKKL